MRKEFGCVPYWSTDVDFFAWLDHNSRVFALCVLFFCSLRTLLVQGCTFFAWPDHNSLAPGVLTSVSLSGLCLIWQRPNLCPNLLVFTGQAHKCLCLCNRVVEFFNRIFSFFCLNFIQRACTTKSHLAVKILKHTLRWILSI